ncbi:MAG: DUF5317 domain-containing protein [Peptococcaceae bacterium]|nr:DUF5317 domain-containing protein [Peptococcaceae bacterium]
MYLLIPIFLSIVVALLRGKDLSRFALQDRFKAPWLVILALVLRVLLYIPPITEYALQLRITPYLNPVPYFLMVLFVIVNLHLKLIRPALILLGFGTLLNLVTVLANGGFMPTRLDMMIYTDTASPEIIAKLQQGIPDCHTILMDESSRLTFLADNFPLPLPHPFAAVFSIGDAIIGIGAFWLFQSIFPPKR